MKFDAIVFGLYETGLGVARSLGLKGLKIAGVDHKNDLGRYSRYIKPFLCPHPVNEEDEFIQWIKGTFYELNNKVPVFFTSDDFLITFSRNRDQFQDMFLFNHVEHSLLENLFNKYDQANIAKKTGIKVPQSYEINNIKEIDSLPDNLNFPLFIKGKDVNSWRKNISGNVKGFQLNNKIELQQIGEKILNKKVAVIIQEVVKGPDSNHYKYNIYISKKGAILGEFILQKIRQNPPHFGVGAMVKSVHFPELIIEGRKLFKAINYRGIGSAEFKIDDRDNKLKLIEINPRYWQQNFLATYCGINFPFLNYADLLDIKVQTNKEYKDEVIWVNRQLDFDSFIKYRKEGLLTLKSWRSTLKGEKVISDFIWNDPLPALYNIEFGLKLIKAPFYLIKNSF